jgi:hypothetical protein
MGETRVDLVHLLEDLRDAYPGSVEETILTEIVANALDSGARTLELSTDRSERMLTALDDGAGMTRAQLRRYHDLGASAKRRGQGIGFAGVGIKLGLLACDEVVTETRRGRVHAATSWKLAGRSRAPWSWIETPHMVEDGDGTAVLLRLTNPLSPLLDAGFIETTVLRNFQPLFEPEFIDILAAAYPYGLTILVDDRVVVGPIRPAARDPIAVRIGRQRKPSGLGYLSRHEEALPEHERGLAISTLGKVILRGWDWLGFTPPDVDRIEGLIEVPALAESLTLNKGDFLRAGQRGALFLAYRKAIQEVVADRLEAWGAAPPPKRVSRTRPFERDIRRVLGELTDDYPLLATLVDRTAGGQRRLPFGDSSAPGAIGAAADDDAAASPTASAGGAAAGAVTVEDGGAGNGNDRLRGGGSAVAGQGLPEPDDATSPSEAASAAASTSTARVRLPGRGRGRRPGTLSLQIRFETLDDVFAISRLIESTVWVNDAHPAYRRARAARSEAYHIALAVAVALAPLAAAPHDTQRFVSAFLASWGAAADRS